MFWAPDRTRWLAFDWKQPDAAATRWHRLQRAGRPVCHREDSSASVVEEARQRSGSYMARVLRPGQVVTMEFNAQRLNLDLNAAGVITGVRCG